MFPPLTSFPYGPNCGGLYRLLSGGCRDYVVYHSVSRERCLLSLIGYLFGGLPISSLMYRDPASHQNRSSVLEHLPGTDASTMSLYLFSGEPSKNGKAQLCNGCEQMLVFGSIV